MPIVILSGKDSFRARIALRELLEKEQDRAPARLERFDEDDTANLPNALAEFFNERTLWQERKIAVVKASSWNAPLPKLAAADLLILLLENPPRPTPRHALVYSFPILQGTQLFQWIRDAAQDLGNTAAPDLVQALVELHGSDTEAIWNELLVLSSASPGRRLTVEDLKTFRTWIPHVKDFALVDAVLSKNRKQALRLLHQTLMGGVPPLLILANLALHFRAMLVAKTPGEAAEAFFRGRHPFWVSKISEHADRFSREELREALRRLWRADYAIKTGKYSPDVALEEFVLGV